VPRPQRAVGDLAPERLDNRFLEHCRDGRNLHGDHPRSPPQRDPSQLVLSLHRVKVLSFSHPLIHQQANDVRPGDHMPPPVSPAPATHLVVMGVSGSGKTSVAAHLAALLGWPAAEADDFHPPANIAKMAAGIPLDDADRLPWLETLRDWMDRHV